jgi:hypothetical protein
MTPYTGGMTSSRAVACAVGARMDSRRASRFARFSAPVASRAFLARHRA